MKIKHFFRVSWLMQLLVGVSLFAVSFLIQSQVLLAFISVPLFALLLSVTLEAGKAVAIVWHRYLSFQSPGVYTAATRYVSVMFRGGLVMLSVLCSVLFLGDHLDRPHLEAVRAGEMDIIQQRLADKLQQLEGDRQMRLAELKRQQDAAYDDVKADYRDRITRLEALLQQEMDNVVAGVFKGPRYAEFERRLAREKVDLGEALAMLSQRHRDEKMALMDVLDDEFNAARQEAVEQAEASRGALLANDFAEDERVNDGRIVAFIKIMASVLGVEMTPLQFVFLFAILISVLMELGIVLAFETVTVSMMPAIAAQAEVEIQNETIKAQVSGEAEADSIRHGAAMDKARKAADRVVERAGVAVEVGAKRAGSSM